MRLVLMPILLSLALAACGGAGSQAAETQRLLAADQSFAADSRDRGTAAAFARVADSAALQLPANAAPVQGGRLIGERMQALGVQVLDWAPQRAEVAASLDLGWTWGEWRLLESAATGKPLAHGKYLRVWRRGGDGAWKLAADIANQADADPVQVSAPP